MKKLIISLAVMALTNTVSADIVCRTTNITQAGDNIFFVTTNINEADIIVYKTSYYSEATTASNYWYFTADRTRADFIFYETKVRGEAKKIVYITTDKTKVKPKFK